MADQPIKLTPLGNLDKDTDYNFIKEGNYVDALDVIKQDDTGNVSGMTQPTQRNKHAFSLGEVVAQNKKYRITVPTSAGQYAVEFRSSTGDPMVDYNGPIDYSSVASGTAVQFYSLANFQVDGWTSGQTGNVNIFNVSYPTVNGVTVIEIELAAYDYYNYSIESVGGDDVNVQCIQEAIPTDLAGPLKDIGSHDLMGDLFIFSTSQDKVITELPLTISALGPVASIGGQTYFSGPVTQITFSSDHNLQVGQSIRISNSPHVFLNGDFVVNNVISSTEIGIVTATAWGNSTSFPVSAGFLGDEIISINSQSIGEYGVAQKNNVTQSWSYTRLIRSRQFNLNTKHKVDCDMEESPERTSVYFDDDYNPYRKIYYQGEYVTDGLLNFVNPANPYQYDTFAFQIYGFRAIATVEIGFTNQLEDGGILMSGQYRYFCVLKDWRGNETDPTDLTNPVLVYDDDRNALAIGNEPGFETAKANGLVVSGIDTTIYEKIAIGYWKDEGGVVSATLLPFNNVESSTYPYTHTGLEDEIAYDVGIFAAKKFGGYQFAKNLRIIDQRIVRSNLRRGQFPELEAWFKTFRHAVCVEEVNQTAQALDSVPSGEFKDPQNVYHKTGYMFNETYRFAGRVYFKDGSISDWNWIDDIKIDPFLTNEGNPTDNRRNQAVANAATSFDLVKDYAGANTTILGRQNLKGTYYQPIQPGNQSPQQILSSSPFSWEFGSNWQHKEVLVPYIEFFDINLTYSVNGTPLINLISAIEFGRVEVVEEVIGTGVAVSSVKINTVQENGVSTEFSNVNGVYRSFPIAGSLVAGGGGDTLLDDNLGIGVLDSDLDGSNETYHEYPFVYSAFPVTNIQDTTGIAGNEMNDNIFPYSFPMHTNVDGGTGWNNFMGVNVILANTETFSTFYPSQNSVSFYQNAQFRTFESQDSVESEDNFEDVLKSERRIHSIYSPDNLFGKKELDGASKLIDFGEMFLDYTQSSTSYYVPDFSAEQRNFTPVGNCFTKYYPQNLANTYKTYEIDNIKNIDSGTRENLFGFNGFRKAHDGYILSRADTFTGGASGYYEKGIPGLWKMASGPVVYTENDGKGIEYQAKNNDHGIRYVQLFKPLINKYQNIELSDYYTTNSKIQLETLSTEIIGSGIVKVFGGDTFTQQSYLKTKIADVTTAPGGGEEPTWDIESTNFPPTEGPGFAGGLLVYTQNKSNSQMRYDTDDQFIMLKDTVSPGQWIWDFKQLDRQTYSDIYNSVRNTNLGQQNANIGDDDPNKYDFPSRITYSVKKIYSEIIDSYTLFYPLDIKDLDLSFGEINHHEDVNGELFTIQPRKYQLQYFNARGTLQGSSSSVEVLIGDGSVLSRDGQTLSSYGTYHKWSVVKGASPSGKDVIYWFNQENGLFMRFGADGTVVLSDRNGMRSFSANNTMWTDEQTTPSHFYGIRSVWDDRFKEAIWTFIGIRETKGEWGLGNKYFVGDIVVGNTTNNYPLDDIPDLYVCIEAHNATDIATEPGNGSAASGHKWTSVAKDDPEYYSVFTLAFNELSNGFSTFYSHLPKTYLKWKNKFLSSHPLHRNELYEHRYGYDKWYEYDGVWKESEPFVEGVVNYTPEQSKKFVAIQSLSENVPDKIEFKTKNQESFLVAADFDPEDDAWRSPIKNDILTSSTLDPNDDTVSLLGSYMRVKFKFFNGAYNKMNNMIIKVRARLRRTSS